MSPSSHDDAVTPVIGTVIVLAITVAGIGMALFMGGPVLVRLRERAALENVVGQFEDVRVAANDMYIPDESRYPTISIPAGQLILGQGSHMLVTVNNDATKPDCDFRVTEWADWNNQLAVSFPAATCRTMMACPATGTNACLQVHRVDGATETAVTASGAGSITLGEDLSKDSDYVFRILDSASAIQAQAWLFHMDRLSWNTGAVDAAYEGGGIFAQEGEGFYLASSPLVSEDPLSGPFFLRVPTLQDSAYGGFTGSGSHSVGLVMDSGHLRVDLALANLVRLDFHGDLAEPWCNAFLLRDVLASLDGDYYRDVAKPTGTPAHGDNDPAHACSGGNAADGVRSVKYQERNASDVVVPFRFTLTQTVLHASLII